LETFLVLAFLELTGEVSPQYFWNSIISQTSFGSLSPSTGPSQSPPDERASSPFRKLRELKYIFCHSLEQALELKPQTGAQAIPHEEDSFLTWFEDE